MNTNLDPNSFSKPVRFGWFPSVEGLNESAGLRRALAQLDLNNPSIAQVEAAVLNTLHRIGMNKFRRHYEIKRIMSFPEAALHELRWNFAFPNSALHLRMYFVLDQGLSVVVGLCFRPKDISDDPKETNKRQQMHIHYAASLAEKYWLSRKRLIDEGVTIE